MLNRMAVFLPFSSSTVAIIYIHREQKNKAPQSERQSRWDNIWNCIETQSRQHHGELLSNFQRNVKNIHLYVCACHQVNLPLFNKRQRV